MRLGTAQPSGKCYPEVFAVRLNHVALAPNSAPRSRLLPP